MTTYGKSPETVRALVEDRWDQMTVIAVPSIMDSSSGIEPAPIWNQLSEILHMLGAVVAGGEVAAFGMRSVTDGLEETIRDRLCEWAIAYTLGEQTEESAA
jgi:hypothetical protein